MDWSVHWTAADWTEGKLDRRSCGPPVGTPVHDLHLFFILKIYLHIEYLFFR